MTDLYADIIIDITHEALDRVFEYRVPLSLSLDLRVGDRVRIPFGSHNHLQEGYIISFHEEPVYDPDKIKEIDSKVSDSISVEGNLIQVAFFLHKYYGGSMAMALRTVLPVKTKMKLKLDTVYSLALPKEEAESFLEDCQRRHYTAKARLMKALLDRGPMEKGILEKEMKISAKMLREFTEKKILEAKEKVHYRNPWSALKQLPSRLPLNEEQRKAVDQVISDFRQGIQKTYLLHGVTGSGKTEVYLALIEEMQRQGRQSIVLIPEISLTYQTVKRFYERFGDRIAVIHSKMSKGEKSDAYARMSHGDVDVVIGARSALFAPLDHLGLIVIDEEHDNAYKSDHTPKYHARETASYRAEISDASLVLGSATPSIESYYRAKAGQYQLLTLKERAGNAALPAVEIVDLREEFRKGNRSIFSEKMHTAIEERLAKKEQVMLFLNRRGFAGFVSCRSCGSVIKCPHCDVSLTYHRDYRNGAVLRCHYCGYETAYVHRCPECGSDHVAGFGLGTEKVEAALHQEFPGARILRMDADTTRRKHAHEEILKTFASGEADILIGTQMIVKGHDYHNVTLVGILAADLSLNENNYRSGEITFQLLCQAAGRAGRGEKEGQVIVQTYQPDHYAIKASVSQDYQEFYQQEIAFRQLMSYPPCTHLMSILITSGDESQAILARQRITIMLQRSQDGRETPVEILSPQSARISKVKDIYRQVIYLKHSKSEVLTNLKDRLEPVLGNHPLFAGIEVGFDMDPTNMI